MLRDNLFRFQNAKEMNREELVRTFVPTKQFYEALDPKNQVLVGTRGSGKTALGRMLSHSHLAPAAKRPNGPNADPAENICTYIACSELMGAKDGSRPELLRWVVNAATLYAFLDTAESCIHEYVEGTADDKLVAEARTVRTLCENLHLPQPKSGDFQGLRKHLEALKRDRLYHERMLQYEDTATEPTPPALGLDLDIGDLFYALAGTLKPILGDRQPAWTFVYDEAEVLSRLAVTHINDYLRAFKHGFYVKLITLPYKLVPDTNLGEALVEGSDYTMVYLDGPLQEWWTQTNIAEYRKFASLVYSKRLHLYRDRDKVLPPILKNLLGDSLIYERPLLDKALGVRTDADRLEVIRQHCASSMYARAVNLAKQDPKLFLQSMWNKVSRYAYLRKFKNENRGNVQPDHYSGWEMVLRCSDGNPRNLIQILDEMVKKALEAHGKLSPVTQSQVLRQYSAAMRDRYRKDVGSDASVAMFIDTIGRKFQEHLYAGQLPGDMPGSVILPAEDDTTRNLAIEAIKIGLLYPNANATPGQLLPRLEEGTFRLAGGLAPLYELLPAKGVARRLTPFSGDQPFTPVMSARLEDFHD